MSGLLNKVRVRIQHESSEDDARAQSDSTNPIWPKYLTQAWLRLSCCGSAHPTRIEDFDGDYAVIGGPIPLHHAPVVPPSPRILFTLGWSNNAGNYEQPVRLIKSEEEPLFLWTVEAVGEGQQTQRRAYFRVETNIAVELHLLQNGVSTEGTALDMSEGGMRCSLPEFTLNPGNREFRITFLIDNKRFECNAHVVRWGSLNAKNQREIGLEFRHQSRSMQDVIRAYVFRRQLEMRNGGIGGA